MLSTERLVLRPWRESDLAPFAALNADPQVMEQFPSPLTREQSDALVERIRAGFAADGFGLWAVEERANGAFVGFVGLVRQTFSAPFTPAVEVGWRLAREVWGRGYATEGARAVLAEAFMTYGLEEVVSMTATTNLPSQAVMKRLGMRRDPAEDFDHPKVPPDSPLRRHVLYRLRCTDWTADRALDPVSAEGAPVVRAPDGSTVRVLPAVEGAGTAIFELAPGAVARAVRHSRVEEIWHVLAGEGELWRAAPDGPERVDRLTSGLTLTLPRGTSFQFRCTGTVRLRVLGTTSPPWAGPADAEQVAPHWPPGGI